MNLTAISASPRRGGNSDLLVDRVVSAAESAGTHCSKHRIALLSIRTCTACDECQKSPETPCSYWDDALPILEDLKQADSIVFGAPIYNFSVAAQLKLLLDRMYSLGGGGRWDALAGRKLGVVLTFAEKDRSLSGVDNAIGMFRDIARFWGLNLGPIVEASCDKAGEVADAPESLAAADELGRILAADSRLS